MHTEQAWSIDEEAKRFAEVGVFPTSPCKTLVYGFTVLDSRSARNLAKQHAPPPCRYPYSRVPEHKKNGAAVEGGRSPALLLSEPLLGLWWAVASWEA